MFSCVLVTFPYGVLGQLWYLIVSIPDICLLSYFIVFRNDTLHQLGSLPVSCVIFSVLVPFLVHVPGPEGIKLFHAQLN